MTETKEDDDAVLKWFAGFKDDYMKYLKAQGEIPIRPEDEDKLKAIYGKMFPEELRSKIRFVGRGTTRIVFGTYSNVCLKFEYNDYRGQSISEIADAIAYKDFTCFPKMLDHSEDGSCTAFEMAEEPSPEEFRNIFGQGAQWISDKLVEYGKTGERRYLDMMMDGMDLNPPQRRAFEDLMQFQAETYEMKGKCLTDLFREDNWGKLYRDGQLILVVTDFGL